MFPKSLTSFALSTSASVLKVGDTLLIRFNIGYTCNKLKNEEIERLVLFDLKRKVLIYLLKEI
jgi:hypothetical protein